MARPGVVFLQRRGVGLPDLAAVARARAILPVLVTALIALPYLAVTSMQPAPDPELVAQGTLLAAPPDPWPVRFVLLGGCGWIALCLADVVRMRRERERRMLRLDVDELECWPQGHRRHIALQDLVGARLEQALGGRGFALASRASGAVLYVRPPGTDRLELVRLECEASAPRTGAAQTGAAQSGAPQAGVPPAGLPLAQDGNAWLVSRLAELIGQRRRQGRPLAACPRMPINVTTARTVSVGGDERGVSVSAGPKHANVPAGAVRSVRLVEPAREGDEKPPLRRLLVELRPGLAESEFLIDLDDSPEEDEVLEYFLFAAARFDVTGPAA